MAVPGGPGGGGALASAWGGVVDDGDFALYQQTFLRHSEARVQPKELAEEFQDLLADFNATQLPDEPAHGQPDIASEFKGKVEHLTERQQLSGWASHIPDWIKDLIKDGMGWDCCIISENTQPSLRMFDAMVQFRSQVLGRIAVPDEWSDLRRDALLIVSLLFNAPGDLAKSDLVVTKLFCLVSGHSYRSHASCLFIYRNGVWSKSSAISHETAEHIMHSLMLAEAVLLIMAVHRPERELDGVIFEAFVVLLHFTPEDLVSALLRAPVRKRETDELWCVRASLNCIAVSKMFAERLHWILEKFHQWGETPMPSTKAAGMAFEDCHLMIDDTRVYQGRWQPANNNYWKVECRLGMSPEYSVLETVLKFLSTTFAGASEPFNMIMAMISLAARSDIMPPIMLFLIGPGGEGKTLFTMKLLKAVFGTGHAECSSTLLQEEQEFRKQGHRYIMKSWLSFDEMKPCHPLEEVFKLFTGGGSLDLRRNHEAETSSTNWARAGKSWNGNVKDIHPPRALGTGARLHTAPACCPAVIQVHIRPRRGRCRQSSLLAGQRTRRAPRAARHRSRLLEVLADPLHPTRGCGAGEDGCLESVRPSPGGHEMVAECHAGQRG